MSSIAQTLRLRLASATAFTLRLELIDGTIIASVVLYDVLDDGVIVAGEHYAGSDRDYIPFTAIKLLRVQK